MTNPYQTPETNLEPSNTSSAVFGQAQKRSAGAGWQWIKDAFNLFMQSPLIWIVLIIIWLVMVVVLSMIPLLSLVLYLIGPIFTGGIMLGCDALNRNDNLSIGHLFAGFKNNTAKLAGLGVIQLLGFILIFIVAALPFLILGIASSSDIINIFNPEIIPDENALITMMLYFLIVMALEIPLIMGIWFAPSLIVFHDIKAWDAFKMSFRGCLSNIIPFLIYGLIFLVLAVVAMIPVGLGMIILLPVMIISMYSSYRSVFLQPA
ncbi:MAG: BPSS1780 family membrane protein [Gammaproteobacteria bacterium]|nr:BPSS1780 family membrane protein [Gammaproteobacteria bacterium]